MDNSSAQKRDEMFCRHFLWLWHKRADTRNVVVELWLWHCLAYKRKTLTKFNREAMCDGAKWREPNNIYTNSWGCCFFYHILLFSLPSPFKHLILRQFDCTSLTPFYHIIDCCCLPFLCPRSESMLSMFRHPVVTGRTRRTRRRQNVSNWLCFTSWKVRDWAQTPLCLPQRPTAPTPIAVYYCDSSNQPQLVVVRHTFFTRYWPFGQAVRVRTPAAFSRTTCSSHYFKYPFHLIAVIKFTPRREFFPFRSGRPYCLFPALPITRAQHTSLEFMISFSFVRCRHAKIHKNSIVSPRHSFPFAERFGWPEGATRAMRYKFGDVVRHTTIKMGF